MDTRRKSAGREPPAGEAFILAGGRSLRMGRDKARLRLCGRTLLAHVKGAARRAGFAVRVVRKDVGPRCGPLGGVLTALQMCRAEVALFLSCDMPFVSAALMRRVVSRVRGRTLAAFARDGRVAGFPFAIRSDALEIVERQVARAEFSLQSLAHALKARRVPARMAMERLNINTPAELAVARQRTSARYIRRGRPRAVSVN